jgi:methyl-accepting chemotaxis protein
VAIGFSFTTGGTTARGYTGDLSPLGALLVTEAPESLIGHHIALTLDGIGQIDSVVRGVSPLGIHIQFGALDAATAQTIARTLDESRSFNRRYISLCQSVADDIGKAFQHARDSHRITEAALFSNLYQEIADTNPQQYLSTSTDLCDAVLPALIERARRSDSRIVFCIACDRNGYIATHHPEVSQQQRPGDPTWNTANSRNRRIFDDRAGILAARNPNPILVQTYQRDLGNGKTVLKEFDAPIMVGGQQWGAVRLAIKP